jgi:NADH:flavin oxidoreductases, Old Yellow Enzyme family
MSEEFSRLFEPVTIGNIEIKNRIAMAPMAILGLVTTEGGFFQKGGRVLYREGKRGMRPDNNRSDKSGK